MSHAIDVGHWNRTFPKYPITVEDHGWIYGVWYCGTSFTKSILYGQYPPGYVKRVLALFPTIHPSDVLHMPSGVLKEGITVDRVIDQVRRPKICADGAALPFADQQFDLILSDPPYSDTDAKQYGTGHFPLMKLQRECLRVLRPGGYWCLLHTMYPSYRRRDGWRLIALIAVVTGFSKRTRLLSIFRKTEGAPI